MTRPYSAAAPAQQGRDRRRACNTPWVQPRDPVLAAGAVVWREVGGRRIQLLMVHRMRYDDWTFPKGKIDAGERLPVTAVRETAEETGLGIHLGVPLSRLEYPLTTGGTKQVSYWCARPDGEGELSFEPTHEITAVRWVDLDETAAALSYDTDRRVLDDFTRLLPGAEHRAIPLIVLRHAKARSRRRWKGDDRRRTLAARGLSEAKRLVPLLQAYGIRTVVSSDSTRCVQTVEPYADSVDVDIALDRGLSQEDATRKTVARRAELLLGDGEPTVVCTHRPVLPMLFDAMHIEDPSLETSQLIVLHRRDDTVVARELHHP